MIEIPITLSDANLEPQLNTEQLTIYGSAIIKTLLAQSVQRTLRMSLTPENQQKFAEEIGFRRALMEYTSYFESPEA